MPSPARTDGSALAGLGRDVPSLACIDHSFYCLTMRSGNESIGQRRSFIEEARRVQIEAAAIASVNDVGYHRASMADIAARAGIAKSAIAYYYDSKEALLLQIVDGAFSALGAALVAAVPTTGSAAQRLAAYAEAYLEHVDRHRTAIAAAAEIVVSHRGADGRPLYLDEQDQDTALLRNVLKAGMDSGEFRPLPIDVAVAIVESLLDRTIMMVQRDASADLSVYRSTVVPFLQSALAPDHPLVPKHHG